MTLRRVTTARPPPRMPMASRTKRTLVMSRVRTPVQQGPPGRGRPGSGPDSSVRASPGRPFSLPTELRDPTQPRRLLTQLFIPDRSTDIDDVIVNVPGALPGFAIYRSIARSRRGF